MNPTNPAPAPRLEEELDCEDSTLTSVRIAEFYSPRKVAFDLFLRLGSGKYLRIFREGENFDEAELKAYESERGVRQVFFEKSRRRAYVSASCSLLQKVAALPVVPLRTKFGVARILSELWMQELFEAEDEARPDLLEQGRQISELLAVWIEGQKGLEDHLLQLERCEPAIESQAFLSGLLAAVISLHFPWKSRRTSETLLLAAFLSDLGLFALKPELRRLRPRRMNASQRREYEKHPEMSYLMLENYGSPAVSPTAMQLTREHHEYCDGSGFPNRATMSKTLQLSKLLNLCGDLVAVSAELLLPPNEAVKVLFPYRSERLIAENPEIADRYEKGLLKVFFPIFTKGDLAA